jgi:hypothetical protein
MRRFLVTAVLSAVVVGACGGDSSDETAKLRAEVAALQQQVAASTTTTAELPTTTAPTTTTSTAAPTPAANAPTPATKPPTTTTRPPTTTTTLKKPEGVVGWKVASNDVIGECAFVKYRLINRSDTAVESVTIKYLHAVEEYKDADGTIKARWWNGVFPEQTQAAGIAPLGGETDVLFRWCHPRGPEVVSWRVEHTFNGAFDALLTWKWFGHPQYDVGKYIGY